MDGYLTAESLETARSLVPIVCVDIVPARVTLAGRLEVGLILRDMPGRDAPVWCHLGGRVRRGETLRAALVRHLGSTLVGAVVDFEVEPQPQYVMQWFPESQPAGALPVHGHDPRQHAVALVYAVELHGDPVPHSAGEATEFRWWPVDELSAGGPPLWPGCSAAITGALEGRRNG
jgi:ADP-ribose pyrophosphatase YjhB (NUDIX family)